LPGNRKSGAKTPGDEPAHMVAAGGIVHTVAHPRTKGKVNGVHTLWPGGISQPTQKR
jgi:hypothetical protein